MAPFLLPPPPENFSADALGFDVFFSDSSIHSATARFRCRRAFLRQKKLYFGNVNKKRHSRKSPRSRSNSSCAERNLGNSHFKEEDREILLNINNAVKELKDEVSTLRYDLNEAKREVTQVKTENVRLKQAMNLNIYSQQWWASYFVKVTELQ